jgi:hypothetical protein
MSRQVGSAHVEFSARTAKVVTGMEEAKRATRQAAREMKADINEAKASIALLGEEVGVKLPRHLRSFVAELPGVASAMAAAFNGAAIIGLGMIAVEQAKKIYEFIHSLEEMGEKTNEAFEKLHKTTAMTTDELIKTNAELANTIAKFEGRKENKLAVQLAEAASAAAALAKQLQAVDEQEMKIFGDEGVSWMKGKAAGMLPTGDLLDHVTAFNKERAEIEDEATEKIRRARLAGDQDAAKEAESERDKQLAAAHDKEMEWSTKTMTDLQKLQTQRTGAIAGGAGFGAAGKIIGAGVFADPTQAILLMTKHMSALNDATLLQDELAQNAALKVKQMGETGPSAAERLKKAQEEAFAAMKSLIAEDLAARTASEHITDALTATWIADEKKQQEETKHSADLEKQATAEFVRQRKEMQEAASETQKSIRQGAADDFALTEQDEQTKVAMAQETNSERLTNLRAAMAEREQIVQQAFADEAALYDEGSKQQQEVQRAALKDAAAYARETAALNREALESGIGGAMTEMVRKAMDTASQLREIFTSLVNGINDQLVNIMTGKRVTSRDWSNMFGGVASQAARAGLTSAEGYAMKALGIGGKPDGSSSGKALWTRSADNIKKAGSDIANLAKGSPDPSTSSGIGGWLANKIGGGGFFGSILSALMPHASGGPVIPGGAYLVGERGPEPFFPGVSGTVGSNAAMRRAFGGSGVTIHMGGIDARGATDPAAVHASVHRAMRSYFPAMVTASAAFQRDEKRRTPALSGGTL